MPLLKRCCRRILGLFAATLLLGLAACSPGMEIDLASIFGGGNKGDIHTSSPDTEQSSGSEKQSEQEVEIAYVVSDPGLATAIIRQNPEKADFILPHDRIDLVTAIALGPIKNSGVEITVSGLTATGGWSNPRLVQVPSDKGEERILTFVFHIDPPEQGSLVTQALHSHEVTYNLTELPADTAIIRIKGERNYLDQPL